MNPIPDRLNELFERTLVCELTTLGRDVPTTTPMQHAWLPDRRVFVLTSPLGVRSKVDRILREPKVCLSFTDFTGSGLTDPEPFLVQGLATVTEKACGVRGLEDFWAVTLLKKPDQRLAAFDTSLRQDDRRLFYLRARIEVSPVRIRQLPSPADHRISQEASR